ncbi:MAG: transporter substrate-binding domain-containing protein [Bdellovibrionales bacterium]|nr:transporter substrate-binding domain-containing protein [Bdellovibrionales bacterium]
MRILTNLIVLLMVCGFTLSACDLPRDPQRTLKQIKARGIRVGWSPNPPFVVRTGNQPSGFEVELIQRLAGSLNTEVVWISGGLEEHLRELSRFEIDLVAAGLSSDTPWRGRVALSKPYAFSERKASEQRVLALPPGENAWLLMVDKFLLKHRDEIERQILEAK